MIELILGETSNIFAVQNVLHFSYETGFLPILIRKTTINVSYKISQITGTEKPPNDDTPNMIYYTLDVHIKRTQGHTHPSLGGL